MKEVFIIKLLLFLVIFEYIISQNCVEEEEFEDVKMNDHQDFQVSPGNDMCLKYSLSNIKSHISFMFFGSSSLTSEVNIYKSKSDIQFSDGSYKNPQTKFLIHENEFKQIDVSEFDDYVYIIIREPVKEDTNEGSFIIYNEELPIQMKSGIPLNMKKFMDNNKYEFSFTSASNLTLVFSSKVKGKKNLTVRYDNSVIIEKKLCTTDERVYLTKPEESVLKNLFVIVEDIEPGKEDEEFSIVVYELGAQTFQEVPKLKEFYVDYINLDKENESQKFYFYYNLNKEYESNTVNFKLDPLANSTGYINIKAGVYHSEKSLTQKEMEDNFDFKNELFPIAYDNNSDIYKRIYFKDDQKEYEYRYLYFKVEITKLKDYFGSKDFLITIGNHTELIDLKSLEYHKAYTIDLEAEALFPKYFKLLFEPEEKYIFTSPAPKNTTYINGDLLELDNSTQKYKINYQRDEDPDEIIEIRNQVSGYTVRILGEEYIRQKIYIEKYNSINTMVNEYSRSNYPLEVEMTQDDCDQKVKKHILGIYDQELYPKGDETYETRYWTTTNGAEMTLYYRDNIQLEGDSLFPDQDEYILSKDELYELNNYIDFYTVTCTKPGKFSIRPHYIDFARTTHKVEENTIETFPLEPDVLEVIQLSAPIVPFKNTSEYLYFSIFSLEGKEVNIAPIQNFIIDDDVTLKGDEPLLYKVQIGYYKPDQLAFNIDTEENRTRIEVIQVVRYNNLNISIVDNDTKTKLTSNHFVRYFPKNLTRVKVKISGLNNVPVTYKLAKLSTDNVNYLPFANQLNSATEETLNSDDAEINLINEKEDDNLKKYVGCVFSVNRNGNSEYYVSFDPIYDDGKKDDDKKDDGKKEEGKDDDQKPEPKPENGGTSGSTITIIILSIIIIGLVAGIIIYCVIKRKQKSLGGGKFEELENDNSHPFAPIMDQ